MRNDTEVIQRIVAQIMTQIHILPFALYCLLNTIQS